MNFLVLGSLIDHPHEHSRGAQANPAMKCCYLVDFTISFCTEKKIAHLKLKEVHHKKTDTFDHYKSSRCISTQYFQFAIFSIDIHQSKFDIFHDIPIYLINIAQVMDDDELYLVDDVIQYVYIYIFSIYT